MRVLIGCESSSVSRDWIGELRSEKGVVLCLCDITGTFAEPWVQDGYDAVLVDPQHGAEIGFDYKDNGATVAKIGLTIIEAMPLLAPLIRSGRVVFVAGFPPCTDVSLSGTKHWEKKRKADPYFQAKAAIVAEQCRMIGMTCGCQWFFENPKSAFTKIFGKPNSKFHPWEYTTHCHSDAYTKDTWLWTGGGFVMPGKLAMRLVRHAVDVVIAKAGRFVPKPKALELDLNEDERVFVSSYYPDDRIHKATPGENRANFRSATPTGFSMAVFKANASFGQLDPPTPAAEGE